MRPFHAPAAAAIALACMALLAPDAMAANSDERRDGADQGGLAGDDRSQASLSVGTIGVILPAFQGSKGTRVQPFPLIDARWGRFFIDGVDGAGVDLVETDRFSAGASVTWVQGYRRRDAPQGVEGVSTATGARVFAKARLDGLTFTAGATQSLGGTQGLVADLGVSRYARLGERLALVPSLQTTWASRKHMDGYFGVDAVEARASGLPEFRAKAGFKDVSASLFATYRLSDRWRLIGQASATRLLGDARNSPLNQTGWNGSGLLGVAYRFH